MSKYLDKQINSILNESIDLLVMGISEILTHLGMEKLIEKFECADTKAFHELEEKVMELKLQNKHRQADKLELFLKKKRAECFNLKLGAKK